MIRLAVPKGRLGRHSALLLDELGFGQVDFRRRYAIPHPTLTLEAVFLKIQDIPSALSDGLVDLAVASDEWLLEHGAEMGEGIPLCWYHVHLDLLAPEGQGENSASGHPVSVASTYPSLTTRLLADLWPLTVRGVAGAVEAYPGRFTDMAVDCLETGETARCNGLVSVRELARCDVRYLSRPKVDSQDPVVMHVEAAVRRVAIDPHCTWSAIPTVSGQR